MNMKPCNVEIAKMYLSKDKEVPDSVLFRYSGWELVQIFRGGYKV